MSKIISVTQHLHVNKTSVSSKKYPLYSVEWETVEIYENLFGKVKTRTHRINDRLLFSSATDAQIYGESVEAPSDPYHAYDFHSNYYFIGYIYPKGWSKIVETVKPHVYMDSVWKIRQIFTLEPDRGIESPVVRINSASPMSMKSTKDYAYLLQADATCARVNELIKYNDGFMFSKPVKSIDITPVGTYESGVTGETMESKKSRDEIIDAELLRIEQYKSFLLSMK